MGAVRVRRQRGDVATATEWMRRLVYDCESEVICIRTSHLCRAGVKPHELLFGTVIRFAHASAERALHRHTRAG